MHTVRPCYNGPDEFFKIHNPCYYTNNIAITDKLADKEKKKKLSLPISLPVMTRTSVSANTKWG